MYRVYYFAFYTKRSLGAIYREYRLVNLKYKLFAHLKKPYKSYTSRGKGKGLNKTVLLFINSEMGKKKSRRGKRSNNSSTKNTKLVFT